MKVYVDKKATGKALERAKVVASLAANRGKPYDVKKPGAKTLSRIARAKGNAPNG
jgi:hypothetical protein